MAGVTFDHVYKRFGDVVAVNDLNLNIADREFLVLGGMVPIRDGVGDLDSIYTLNNVGATIWKLIDGTRTADDIALAVVEAFEVEPEQARRDVEEFLASLTEAGMIGRAGAEKHR